MTAEHQDNFSYPDSEKYMGEDFSETINSMQMAKYICLHMDKPTEAEPERVRTGFAALVRRANKEAEPEAGQALEFLVTHLVETLRGRRKEITDWWPLDDFLIFSMRMTQGLFSWEGISKTQIEDISDVCGIALEGEVGYPNFKAEKAFRFCGDGAKTNLLPHFMHSPHLMEILLGMGQVPKEVLLKLLSHPKRHVRAWAIRHLEDLGTMDRRARRCTR